MQTASGAGSGFRIDHPYAAVAAAVTVARWTVDRRLSQWGMAQDLRDRVSRVCTELMSNAVAASPAGELVRLRLESFPTTLKLSVFDKSPVAPAIRAPDFSTNESPETALQRLDDLPDCDSDHLLTFGGYGLHIVAELADTTGVDWLHPEPDAGKWSWASFERYQG